MKHYEHTQAPELFLNQTPLMSDGPGLQYVSGCRCPPNLSSLGIVTVGNIWTELVSIYLHNIHQHPSMVHQLCLLLSKLGSPFFIFLLISFSDAVLECIAS
jgi:hypothetical protein